MAKKWICKRSYMTLTGIPISNLKVWTTELMGSDILMLQHVYISRDISFFWYIYRWFTT